MDVALWKEVQLLEQKRVETNKKLRELGVKERITTGSNKRYKMVTIQLNIFRYNYLDFFLIIIHNISFRKREKDSGKQDEPEAKRARTTEPLENKASLNKYIILINSDY